MKKNSAWFPALAKWASTASGRPVTFTLALSTVVAWAITGPIFSYSDTWQLVINTATTIVTFLMVFLIQNTQNRDTQALQLKLDELIRVTKGAHNLLIELEGLDDEQLEQLRQAYERLGKTARNQVSPKSIRLAREAALSSIPSSHGSCCRARIRASTTTSAKMIRIIQNRSALRGCSIDLLVRRRATNGLRAMGLPEFPGSFRAARNCPGCAAMVSGSIWTSFQMT